MLALALSSSCILLTPTLHGELPPTSPVTAEVLASQVGPGLRISDMGVDGDASFDAREPAVAYDPTRDRYLVVWEGEDTVSGETEIWGQLVDGDGTELGANDFRISTMGPDLDPAFAAGAPDVAYSAWNDGFLVVWQGDERVDGEVEIWGQLLDASGAEVGPDDFRISRMGPDGDTDYEALAPAVAARADGRFLVLWHGDDDEGTLVEGEYEIRSQLIDRDGTLLGPVHRISDMGPDGDPAHDAAYVDVVYDADFGAGIFVAVWEGTDLPGGESEIYYRSLGSSGGSSGPSDRRLSDMGPDGDPSYEARRPSVAVHVDGALYVVVWSGSDTTPGEFEIYAQGFFLFGPVPTNDVRLTTTGPDGDPAFGARAPAILREGYLPPVLVWEADTAVAGEREIFLQELDAAYAPQGPVVQLSDMGSPGDTAYDAATPAIAHGSVRTEHLVVWSGDHDAGALVDDELETWGQRFEPDSCGLPGTVQTRNPGVPNNPVTYDSTPIVPGQTFTATVDNAAVGQTTSILIGLRLHTYVVLGGGQVLLIVDGGGGEVFTGAGLSPAFPGPVDGYELAIPVDVGLCGFAFSSQALQFGNPPFVLSNARDYTVGN